jgi:hypothetical protein
VGAIAVLTSGVSHPSFDDGQTFFWWIFLSILCPPMAILSWIFIKYHPGRPRYIGLWVRFGADLGQFFSFSAFLSVISEGLDPIASEVYTSQIFAAIWWFIIILLVRDAWKLILTERVAVAIEQQKDDENESTD